LRRGALIALAAWELCALGAPPAAAGERGQGGLGVGFSFDYTRFRQRYPDPLDGARALSHHNLGVALELVIALNPHLYASAGVQAGFNIGSSRGFYLPQRLEVTAVPPLLSQRYQPLASVGATRVSFATPVGGCSAGTPGCRADPTSGVLRWTPTISLGIARRIDLARPDNVQYLRVSAAPVGGSIAWIVSLGANAIAMSW
jgi:hypothetical protein